MNIIADTHTHTLASTHAYSTILENAKYASEIGMKYIAVTDHGPTLIDAPHSWHFGNLKAIPDFLYGVRILKGIEVNILHDGELDMPDEELAKLEWVVASIHPPVYEPTSIEKNTLAYCKAILNPHVDVIGHSGLLRYQYDYEEAVKLAGQQGKLFEINNHSFECRSDGIDNCITIAKLCKKYRVGVVVNSDAHFAYAIGDVGKAINLLEEIDFPKELVINSRVDLFEEYLDKRKKRIN